METVSIHGTRSSKRSKRTLLSLAALLALLMAMAVGTYLTVSASAFTLGDRLVIGPRFTGTVELSPGCTFQVVQGRFTVPYRRGRPNGVSYIRIFPLQDVFNLVHR